MTLLELYILFWLYAFLGWVMETSWVAFKLKKLTNRGFFLGPYCPIYGIGAVLLLLLDNYRNDPLTILILSIFICSLVEYLASYFLELAYKVRWWDYSNQFFNINGRICLFNSFCFGLFGLLTVCVLNPFFTNQIMKFNSNLKLVIFIVIFIITTVDMFITFSAMFDFRKYVSNLKEKTFTNLFKTNTDSTEEMSKRVRNKLKEKSFIHKHLSNAFYNLKVNRDAFLKKGEELIKYRKMIKIENTFIIGSIISIIVGFIIGYIFNNIRIWIIIAFIINLIIVKVITISKGKNGK